jgi:predicted MPP superfamily phosphohydrolase
LNRRKFLWLGSGALFGGIATGGYASLIEPHHLVLEHRTIRLPHLSSALEGFRMVLMSDHHLFPFTPRELVECAVEQANALRPDLVLLAGDYVAGAGPLPRSLLPAGKPK